MRQQEKVKKKMNQTLFLETHYYFPSIFKCVHYLFWCDYILFLEFWPQKDWESAAWKS